MDFSDDFAIFIGMKALIATACLIVIAAGTVYLWNEWSAAQARAAESEYRRKLSDCRGAADRIKGGASTDADIVKVSNCVVFWGFSWANLGLPEPKS